MPGDPGLTSLGKEQAGATADWLARSESPVAIYSSPMRRAVETATAVAERFSLRCAVDPRLRERMNWTDADGESIDEFLADWVRATADRSYTPRSGDSSHEAANRFLEALGDVAEAHRAGTVVVVAHGGVTTDTLRTLLGDGELSARAPRLRDQGVPCCAITTLQFGNGVWSVPSIAVTGHLGQSC